MDPFDDKAECLKLAQKIEEDIQTARNHRIINTCMLAVAMIMISTNFWRSLIVSRQIKADFDLSLRNADSIGMVKANQDLYRQQTLDYIKDMITTMQELQDKNPQLKVPKAPVPRPLVPPMEDDITPEDLRRIPQTKPGPTPTPIVIEKTKRVPVRVKPKPTPLFKWPWQHPKSTR
jgi:hypothetical protein